MPIFDTHAHYDSGSFNADREAVLSALPEAGVGLVVDPGCDVPSSRAAVALAEQFPHVYAAVGIHPEDCAGCTDADFDAVRTLCAHEKVVAIGEIGLDYYWKENPPQGISGAGVPPPDRAGAGAGPARHRPRPGGPRGQSADRAGLPGTAGVFHCFSGSPEMAAELLKRGWYLGFDGPITYKNAKRAPEVAAVTPLDRMVIETDAPYMTPVPFRGKRNDSRLLPYVAEKLAQWKGVTTEEMIDITWRNGLRLFGLEEREKTV